MHTSTAARLIALNRRFYTDFGPSFSVTRGRIQPGVRQVLAGLAGMERILDLGCGNGQLARALAERGHAGSYLGLDFSLPLLADAPSQPAGFPIAFHQADLSAPDWETQTAPLSLPPFSFDRVFAFAFLHHIPGHERRLDVLRKARVLLAPAGKFIHSEWQFLESEKLRARIQPWERAGLSAAEVDEGDALLDWRSGGEGLRYVHHFSQAELARLAAESGFRVATSFLADGQGGRLSLYQSWEAE